MKKHTIVLGIAGLVIILGLGMLGERKWGNMSKSGSVPRTVSLNTDSGAAVSSGNSILGASVNEGDSISGEAVNGESVVSEGRYGEKAKDSTSSGGISEDEKGDSRAAKSEDGDDGTKKDENVEVKIDKSPTKAVREVKTLKLKNKKELSERSSYTCGAYSATPAKDYGYIYFYNSERKKETLIESAEGQIEHIYLTENKIFFVDEEYEGSWCRICYIPIVNGMPVEKKYTVISKDYADTIIYANDEYVLCLDDTKIRKYFYSTGKKDTLNLSSYERYSVDEAEFIFAETTTGNILVKNHWIYMLCDYENGGSTVYKINIDTLKVKKVRSYQGDYYYKFIPDEEGNVVVSAEYTGQPAIKFYYQESGKAYKMGTSMYTEKILNSIGDPYKEFMLEDDEESEIAPSRDAVQLLFESGLWNYTERSTEIWDNDALFIRDGRVYFDMKLRMDPDKEANCFGTFADFIYSAEVKNYNGVRLEKNLIDLIKTDNTVKWTDEYDIESPEDYDYYETGEFDCQISNILVFRFEETNIDYYHYIFYDMDTGEYKKVQNDSEEIRWLYYVGSNQYAAKSDGYEIDC